MYLFSYFGALGDPFIFADGRCAVLLAALAGLAKEWCMGDAAGVWTSLPHVRPEAARPVDQAAWGRLFQRQCYGVGQSKFAWHAFGGKDF